MMKKIKIIERDENLLKYNRFSANDIQLYVERLKAETTITLGQIDEIRALICDNIQFNNIIMVPSMADILIRKLVLLAQTTLYKRAVKTVDLLPIVPIITRGEVQKSTKLYFEAPTYTIETENNLTFVAHAGEQVNIVALKIQNDRREHISDDLVQNEFDRLIHKYKCENAAGTKLAALIMRPPIIPVEHPNYFIGPVPPLESVATILTNKNDIKKLFILLEELTGEKMANQGAVTAIDNYEQWGILLAIDIYGRDSDKILDIVDKFKIKMARVKVANIIKQKEIKTLNELSTYINAVEKKFGTKRIRGLKSIDDVMAILTGPERNIINKEIRARRQFMSDFIKNDCPHVNIYRRLRGAKTNDHIFNTLEALKKFFISSSAAAAKENKFIFCNNCDFLIICPHVVEMYEYTLAGKSYNYAKGQLYRYIDDIPGQTNLYCRICGEIIIDKAMENTNDITMGEYGKLYGSIEDTFKTTMWKEIIFILNFVKFDILINKQRLIDDIINTTYNHILSIQKELTKSKTNSFEDVQNKTKMVIIIFTYAYLVHIMTTNKNIFFTWTVSAHKNPLLDNLERALNLILNTKNILISKIQSLTTEEIKRELIEAYKLISSGGDKKIDFNNTKYDIFTNLILDPIYNYIFSINSILFPGGKFDKILSIKKLLNIRLSDDRQMGGFDGGINPYERVTYNFKNEKSGGVHLGYILGSFKLFMEKIAADLYLAYTFDGDNYANYIKKYNVLMADVAQYLRGRIKNIFLLNYFEKTTYRFKYVELTPGVNYDEQGRRHKWDIFVYEGGQELKEGPYPAAKLIDFRCSVCGIFQTEAKNNKLDKNKILVSLKINNEIVNFYRFYKYRCPLGNLHEYKNDVCIKCKKKRNDNSSKEYYLKYKANMAATAPPIKRTSVKVVPPRIMPADLKKWNFNYNNILTLAKILNIKDNVLMSLGDYEGQNYSDIQSNKHVPAEASTKNDLRIINLHSYVKEFLFYFNNLRAYGRLIKPPDFIKNIVERDKSISSHEYTTLSKLLPDIYDDYDNKLLQFKQNKKPEDVVQFILQFIATAAIKIYNFDEKKGQNMRHDFVKEIMRQLIEKNTQMTTYINFNWNIFVKKGEKYKDIEAYNSNYDDDGAAATYEELETDELGTTAAPLKNKFDVDEDDDVLENNDVGANIGEDYALS